MKGKIFKSGNRRAGGGSKFLETSEKTLGPFARLASANHPAVERDDRYHLGCRAGEETFVGDEDIIARNRTLDDRDAEFFSDLEDHRTRDAIKRAIADQWRVKFSVLDEEKVVARALGDIALFVEHDRLKRIGLDRLDLGHDVVEVVERLDLWHQGTRCWTTRRAGDDRKAFLVMLVGVELDRRCDDEHRWLFAKVGIQAQLPCSARYDEADVTVGQTIGRHRVAGELADLFLRPRHVDHDRTRRIKQAPDVFLESEDPAIVKPDALKHADDPLP